MSQETRLFTQPSQPPVSSRRREEEPEEEDEEATRPVRASDRWKEQPIRHAGASRLEDEEDEDEDDRDPVAENIIRWVPPITALICAGIALYGFLYYQFFL